MIVADLTLQRQILQEIVSKSCETLSTVAVWRGGHKRRTGFPSGEPAQGLAMAVSTMRYCSRRVLQEALRGRLQSWEHATRGARKTGYKRKSAISADAIKVFCMVRTTDLHLYPETNHSMAIDIKSVTPIARTTLTVTAFEQLISRVVKGNWKPGERIPPERELCQKLGIARTSLREALKAMELIGFLDSRVGDGTFVCPRSEFLSRPLLWAFTGTDQNELHDIMEARIIMEENLAGLAAERGDSEAIAAIGQAVQMMRDSIARGDSILEADLAFHAAISVAAKNQVLESAVQLLRGQLRQWIYFNLHLSGVASIALKQHQTIYLAILRHKPAAARSAMHKHLQETMALVTRAIKQSDAKGQAVASSMK